MPRLCQQVDVICVSPHAPSLSSSPLTAVHTDPSGSRNPQKEHAHPPYAGSQDPHQLAWDTRQELGGGAQGHQAPSAPDPRKGRSWERRGPHYRARGNRSQGRASPAAPGPRPRVAGESMHSLAGRLSLSRQHQGGSVPMPHHEQCAVHEFPLQAHRARLDSPRPMPPGEPRGGPGLGQRGCKPLQTAQGFKWKKDLNRPFSNFSSPFPSGPPAPGRS